MGPSPPTTFVETCPARAALAGNPSDGYGGAVVSVPVMTRWATVRLRAAERTQFDTATDLVAATLSRHGRHIGRTVAPCTIEVTTTIPRSVGLAGSSAIVIALLRALQRHAGLPAFSPDELASLALSVEVDELGFAAGLQDRVVQAHGRPMVMRFGDDGARLVAGLTAGTYVELSDPIPGWLTVAARASESEPSQRVHRSLRERYDAGDPKVAAAMTELASAAWEAVSAISARDAASLGHAMDRTFDIRRSIMDIRPGQEEMVEVARRAGAFANFAGSGGAVSVLAVDDARSRQASAALVAIGCEIIEVTRPDTGECHTPSVPSTS
jgi:glucuronokinase